MTTASIISLLLFPIGFYALIKGADWLVEGASSIAKKFNISNITIGLTIVALGTSMPELLVNIIASAQGATDLAIGNVIGSNISNIFLILGISAVIYPLSITKGTVWKEIPLNLLAVAALFVLANDIWIDGDTISILSRIDGIILMFFFIIFMYYSYGISKNHTVMGEVELEKAEEGENIPEGSTKKSVLLIIAGIIALPLGGKLVIDGALAIVDSIGLSESFVGLTILALGTSLPELATSAIAAYKKNVDIAIGNVVGSNLFNIFWVLGLSALIRPLPPSQHFNIDILACAIATGLLFLFIAVRNTPGRWWVIKIQKEDHALSKTEGIVFLILYAIYIGYLIYRG